MTTALGRKFAKSPLETLASVADSLPTAEKRSPRVTPISMPCISEEEEEIQEPISTSKTLKLTRPRSARVKPLWMRLDTILDE